MSETIGLSLVFIGVGFFLAGSIGLLRLPDLLSRLHALTKADNLGLGLLAAGLGVLGGDWLIGIKLFLIWLLVMGAGAAASHLIAGHWLRQEKT